MSGRVPDGAEVKVLRYSRDRAWLEVQTEAGARGWITGRYVEKSAPAAAAAPARVRSAWASPEECEGLLAARDAPAPGSLRLGSWNVRWFPDGSAGRADQPTNLRWLACVIAVMGVDVLGVQEFKRGVSDPRVRSLLADLNQRTRGKWELLLDSCPADNRQHVGLLFNSSRVQVTELASLSEVNPQGKACDGRLRPGLAARVAHPGGVDFELLVLHLKSGPDSRSYELRRASMRGLDRLVRARVAQSADEDFVLLGDLNSMGCSGCKPEISADEERKALSLELGVSGLELLQAPCTHYYQGRGGALDHIGVRRTMLEAQGRLAQVVGVCADFECTPRAERSRAEKELSDHCPVLLDLNPADLD